MRGRGNIFEDLHKLNEMLELRRQGHGPSELGRRYGVDHTTIVYHCKRHGLVMPRGQSGVTTSGLIAPIVVVERKVRISVAGGVPHVIIDPYDNTPICQGANYAEYMQSKQKQREARFMAMMSLTGTTA